MRLFETRRQRVRREIFEAGFREEWRKMCEARFRWWNRLDGNRRERLELLALELIATKKWEAARDFALTQEMMVVISVQAALLVLELPADSYRNVQAIIVHPTTLMLQGEHSQVDGVVSDDPLPILGEANFNGPVLVAWDEVDSDSRHPRRGHNVVFHEFAHALDMLDGTTDGTPPLATREQFERWVEVCTHTYEQAVSGHGGHSLDNYAGVNPAEFFAVATESFFSDPQTLKHEHSELYAVLEDFYRQDPLHWTATETQADRPPQEHAQ
jgi:Mlc titration factor MtfA (ptsG expression regulator)